MVIVRDDFLALSDRSQHPENRNTIWAMMQIHNTVIGHFTHFGIPVKTVTKLRAGLISKVFGVVWRRAGA
jgi:hypothetical protein